METEGDALERRASLDGRNGIEGEHSGLTRGQEKIGILCAGEDICGKCHTATQVIAMVFCVGFPFGIKGRRV